MKSRLKKREKELDFKYKKTYICTIMENKIGKLIEMGITFPDKEELKEQIENFIQLTIDEYPDYDHEIIRKKGLGVVINSTKNKK